MFGWESVRSAAQRSAAQLLPEFVMLALVVLLAPPGLASDWPSRWGARRRRQAPRFCGSTCSTLCLCTCIYQVCSPTACRLNGPTACQPRALAAAVSPPLRALINRHVKHNAGNSNDTPLCRLVAILERVQTGVIGRALSSYGIAGATPPSKACPVRFWSGSIPPAMVQRLGSLSACV